MAPLCPLSCFAPFHPEIDMTNFYITGTARRCGKTALSLSFMERMSSGPDSVGYFRPIVAREDDPSLEMIKSRHGLAKAEMQHYGILEGEARPLLAAGHKEEVIKRILGQFQILSEHYPRIVCEGADYGTGLPGAELDFNLEIANHLGCLVVPVLDGQNRTAEQLQEDLQDLHQTLSELHSQAFTIVINRVNPEDRAALRTALGETSGGLPLHLLPQLALLDMPTVGEIAHALDAEVLSGNPDSLGREVASLKVAAMELPHFLDHLEDASLIITPGDRADIIVGSLLADVSLGYPQIAGILLSGGLRPAPQLRKLVRGLVRANVPILLAPGDTFNTAMAASKVQARLTTDNPRKLAAALALSDKLKISRESLLGPEASARPKLITPLRFEYELIQQARQNKRHIVLPEGLEERILRAAEILLLRDVVDITLLGDPEAIRAQATHLGLHLEKANIINPNESPLSQSYAETLYEARKHKDITLQMAQDMIQDFSYFGTLMVHRGDAHGMVSGAVNTTQHTIRPAFQVIRAARGHEIISSIFLMSLADRVLVYGDCAVNPEPTAMQLAEIAISSAKTARQFGIEPRVAMLSYSTGDSGEGEAVEKVRKAVAIARARAPDLQIEGPIQYDAAVDESVARTKLPGSQVAGRATVFIFPDLNTGNNTYKAVQRTAGAVAIGPILQGLNKPVNDLSRGCTVADIVNTVAITAIQAQESP
jgi:phosphate acetyltransferase